MKVHLTEFRPNELRARVSEVPLVLVPVGTIEWHAEHLPLGVDSLLSLAVCEQIAQTTGCVVTPPVWCGICRDLAPEDGYYGTLNTISESTLEHLVADLLGGLAQLGFRKAVLVSGHFEMEHYNAIQRGIDCVEGLDATFLTTGGLIEDQVQPGDHLTDTWHFAADHAAEFETSLMQYNHPQLVHMADAPEKIELRMDGLPEYLHERFPRRASAEYGQQLQEHIVLAGVRKVQELLAE